MLLNARLIIIPFIVASHLNTLIPVGNATGKQGIKVQVGILICLQQGGRHIRMITGSLTERPMVE